MDLAGGSLQEALARLRPTLELVFVAYEVSEREAREILEESCLALAIKWSRLESPDAWLLRTVVDRCRRARGDGAGGG